MNAQPALDDYLRDLLGGDVAPAIAPAVAAPAPPQPFLAVVNAPVPAQADIASPDMPAGVPAVVAELSTAGEPHDDAGAFDPTHEEVLERLLATTRGIAVADDPDAILALQQVEAAPAMIAPATATERAPMTVETVAVETVPVETVAIEPVSIESEPLEIPSVDSTPAAAPPAMAPMATADLITDDEFEALLDQLHGGAAPGAQAPAVAATAQAEPTPPAPMSVAAAPAPATIPSRSAPPPPARPASSSPAIPAYAKPVFDMLRRQRDDEDNAPASSPHGERRRASDRTTRWLRMRCDDQHYALELLKVQEVVLPATLLPLRGAAAHMLGVMNLRGQVVPVIDLGLYLGRAEIVADSQVRIVVLEENGEILGLRVSAVEDVTRLTEQQIEPPDNTRMCRITHPLFRGVARLSGRTVILLDASELLG
ncbi:chemotaxis protein CheW [Pseudoxanthomonas japonensis]|nr:chemotaxis protein CheW [Pseudoxanthomonas japonensis]